MIRLIALFLLGVVCTSCDTLSYVNAYANIAERPERDCMIEAFMAEPTVSEVHVRDDGDIGARLTRPAYPHLPDVMAAVEVDIFEDKEGRLILRLFTVWFGRGPIGKERREWQSLLDGIRDRVIERCALSPEPVGEGG